MFVGRSYLNSVQQFFDDEWNKHVIICREMYLTDRVILNCCVNMFDHLECELHLHRWFDKADNLWLDDDLPWVSRVIVCDCLTGLPLDEHSLCRILEAFHRLRSNLSWWWSHLWLRLLLTAVPPLHYQSDQTLWDSQQLALSFCIFHCSITCLMSFNWCWCV